MDRETFNNLCSEDQEIVFDEMCSLYNLISKYPVTYDDLKVCTEWISYIGCHGESLEKRLNGFYPYKWLTDEVNIDKIMFYSDEAVKLVTYWNKIVRQIFNAKNECGRENADV